MTSHAATLRAHSFAGLAGSGPRLIVLGAVHGNETCGPRAIERVLPSSTAARCPSNGAC